MKRSNMITLISKIIKNSGGTTSFTENYCNEVIEIIDLEEVARDILSAIEECGMQPPNIKLKQLFPNSIVEVSEDSPVNHWHACWEPE